MKKQFFVYQSREDKGKSEIRDRATLVPDASGFLTFPVVEAGLNSSDAREKAAKLNRDLTK
jgi:hypothetical protein